MISKKPKVVMIREKLEQWLKLATDVLIRYLKWIQFWKRVLQTRTRRRVALNCLRRHWQMKER